MPLAELNPVVLFAHEFSLIQPRLLTDEYFARFRWSCLSTEKVIQQNGNVRGAYGLLCCSNGGYFQRWRPIRRLRILWFASLCFYLRVNQSVTPLS